MTGLEVADRLRQLESQIAQEKGPFVFFALFMRGEVPDRWDLMVSAPWVGEDKSAAVSYFVGQIKSRLGANALISLSRIVIIDPQDTGLQALNRLIEVEHGGR